jgi:hypothetical protein
VAATFERAFPEAIKTDLVWIAEIASHTVVILSAPEHSESESKNLHFRGFQTHPSSAFPGAIKSASGLLFSTMIELPDQE